MDWTSFIVNHWQVKIVVALLLWAAWIDGRQLRVPNWLTFPMVGAGILLNSWLNGYEGFQFAMWGMTAGLLTLLPLYAIGGMGAGDVKLMAGIGAWLGWEITWASFVVTVVVGMVMAIVMVVRAGQWKHHYENFQMILNEILVVRDPQKLFATAKERKHTMRLLPYGIPICIGSIAYFAYAGLLA